MKIPTTPAYKPVIVVENYDKIDGHFAWETDVKGLSLGLAQWNERDTVEISGKVWHETEEAGSLQTEELPINRILDLAILVVQTTKYFQDAYRYEKFYDVENPRVEIIGLQGNRMTVEIATENPEIDEDILFFHDTLQKDGELVGERLRTLKRLLDEAGY